MKLTKLWASALGLLALASCSKDAEPNQPVEQPTTKVVHINLTAGQDDAGLRATYGVKTDNSGALTGLQMSDKNVVLRVVVRQGTGNDAIAIQDLTFTKTAGRNHATYSGPITIPISGTGSYTIAAFLMREEGVDGEVFLTEKPEEMPVKGIVITHSNEVAYAGTDNKLKLAVPYITDWQPITVGSEAVNPTTLYLKPFGTILRMRIKNETASAVKFKQITFQTTAFTAGYANNAGEFYPDQERDNKPFFRPYNEDSYRYTIPSDGVEVPGTTASGPGYSPWMYIWAAPRTITSPGATTAFLSFSTASSAPKYKAFYTTQYLPTGSVPMTLVYNGQHNMEVGELPEYDGEWGGTVPTYTAPLSYLHPYALNSTKDGFVTDQLMTNPNVGRFTYTDIVEFMTPKALAGGSYSLPTAEELRSIFPPQTNSSGVAMNEIAADAPLYDVVEEGIKVGSNPVQSYKADYVRRSNNVLYAIRLKSASNRYRTAYRYRPYTVGTEKGVVVESTYIGGENISLSNVEQSDFWTNQGRVVTSVKLPAYGFASGPSGAANVGVAVAMRSSTAIDEVGTYTVTISSTVPRPYVTLRGVPSSIPIYLFKRN